MTRFLAILSGALLVSAVTLILPWAGLGALGLVVAGWWFRPATIAVILLTIGVLGFEQVSVTTAAALGLVATAYLMYAASPKSPSDVLPSTVGSVVGAVGFTTIAMGAAWLELQLAWAPIAAPFAVILLFALTVAPLMPRGASTKN